MLNGSNARTYRLVLTRDGESDHGRITQIGTQSGLLLAPTPLPTQGLVLASAERADLLVDFSDLPPGTELTLWNTATAPFDGTFADPATAGTADLDGLLPYPEVLRVRVVDGRRERRPTPQGLATDFRRVTRDELDGVVLRAIALVEQASDAEGAPPMLTLRELVEDPDDDGEAIAVVERLDGGEERETRWRTVATRFEDTVTFLPVLGQPEIWRLVNLTGDTHPIHVHLDAFQVLDRRRESDPHSSRRLVAVSSHAAEHSEQPLRIARHARQRRPFSLRELPRRRPAPRSPSRSIRMLGQAIEGWQAVRPSQPSMLDRKTGERVDFLFAYRPPRRQGLHQLHDHPLRGAGHCNIARGLRWAGRDPTRAFGLLGV